MPEGRGATQTGRTVKKGMEVRALRSKGRGEEAQGIRDGSPKGVAGVPKNIFQEGVREDLKSIRLKEGTRPCPFFQDKHVSYGTGAMRKMKAGTRRGRGKGEKRCLLMGDCLSLE